MTESFRFDYERYTNLAFHRRGAFINETIMLERLIDDYIASHFCSDTVKKNEIMELIVCTNRIIFENKVQVLKILLERHSPDVLKTNTTLINDITQTVIPERNIFAHYWLVTSNDLSEWIKENKTVFIKFKNITKYVYYDQDKFSELMKLIAKCIRVLVDLQK